MQRVRSNIPIKTEAIGGSKQVYVRPFWLSNWTYFGGAVAFSLILFFFLWSILSEDGDAYDSTWFPAFLVSTIFFAFAAALHGVLLRRVKNKYLLRREQMKFPSGGANLELGKFTLEKHVAALKQIQRKSEAADATTTNGEAHLEVYRACGDYLEQVEIALPTVHAGSPRLAAFRSGQERVRGLQKHHLLAWAEEESRGLLREAQIRVTTNEKVETAQRALEVLDAALQIYPEERQLAESSVAVQEFIAASYVAHWVELAERAAFKENYEQAVDHYRDALFYLSREAPNEAQRQATAIKIESEINRLQILINQQAGNGKSLKSGKSEELNLEAEN
ncbi:MAG: hypothetical protein M3209_14645 [Acidobacteriota bacterium]|nr:hypothetical protein [Acidobacteriota bacterium]